MGKLEKIPAWHLTKVKNKTEVIAEAKKGGKTAHFASLMDLCHLKNSKLEPKFQKFKGRVVFRGDSVKNDSGSYAVFTEQGSSALQMTAAKIMDITSRLPGCARQAADAVSAYTHLHSSQNGRSTDVAKNSQIGMYHDTNGLNRGPVWKSQLFFLSEICTVIFWLLWERAIRESSFGKRLEKGFKLGMFTRTTVKKRFILSVSVDDIKWLERNKTLIRCGKYSIKKLIWENQHLSLIMYTWGVLNRPM